MTPRRPILMLFILFMPSLANPFASAVELPKTEEERSKLSGREITILRRQMKAREDEAEATYKNAETAFLVGEYDKAIEEYLAVSKEYDDTSFRMRAVCRVGDVYYKQKKFERAVSYYQRSLKIPSELWWPEDVKESYARADYMIGVCYYDQKAMNQAFAHFRRFVKTYPDSAFVDRAYDFIGRGNMEMERYGQAIEAFGMVGTAKLEKETRRTISPGEDLYVRVTDADVGLASKGTALVVRLNTTAGDQEILNLSPLGLGSPVFLGTIKTRLGAPRLTKLLEEIFTSDKQNNLDRLMNDAAVMQQEQDRLRAALNALPQPAAQDNNDPQAAAQQEKLRVERQALKAQIDKLDSARKQLQQQAFTGLDASYAAIEKILEQWDVKEQELAQGPGPEQGAQASAAEDDDEDGATEDERPKQQDQLSDLYTPAQIADTRKSVKSSPTDMTNFTFRRALLEYWYDQLLLEYKTLDVNGADTVTVEYLDQYGSDAENILRKDSLTIASDATIACVGPDFSGTTPAVILGDNVRVLITDPDMDRRPERDSITVAVAAVPKQARKDPLLGDVENSADQEAENLEAETDQQSVDLFANPEGEKQDKPVLIPEDAPSFKFQLQETEPHSGVFTGEFPTVADEKHPASALKLSPETRVRVAYQDDRNTSHDGDWVVVAEVGIVLGAEGSHEVIEMQESKLDRRSELEKGIALGKLARVYQDLGIDAESQRTFDDALSVVKKVVDAEGNSPLGEEATFQMWNLYFASGNEEAAAEACSKLIAAFPNSPLADDALLIMGKAADEEPQIAAGHFARLVQQYPDSPLAPEAQFLLAEMKSRKDGIDVASYEACANRYPESNFAAESLLRLADYYIENRDYTRALDYLERVSLDFPDFDKLDQATFKRAVCVYRSGDIQLAYTLMHEVIEKYPGTASAETAAKIVQTLAKKLER